MLSRFLWTFIVLLFCLPFSLSAQVGDSSTQVWKVVPFLQSPYAGKFEPRIGGWVESADSKLRLDIGTSVNLWDVVPMADPTSRVGLVLGTEFFTWTRLRSAGGFKFPVEAVDYYFGLFGQFHLLEINREWALNAKLRAAHISAHLVDGDSLFFASGGKPMTYSREFLDLRVGGDFGGIAAPLKWGYVDLHPYVGGHFLFNTIPDTLGRFSPYAGVDLAWQQHNVPISLRAGYEARLNTELEPIGEHLIRAGIKLASVYANGVIIEGAYYSGRSPYGQLFNRRENYFSLGFSVEH